MRGLLFDKDGTLFDFRATWAAWCDGLIADLAQGDAVRAAVLAEAIGYDRAAGRFHKSSPVIAETVAVLVAVIRQALPDVDPGPLQARLVATATAAPQVEAVPLAPLLDRLSRAGLMLGVATNDAEASARAHLARAGVGGLFTFIAGYDSGHGGKPGPGMPAAFARATGLAPADCAMIGDSTHDLVSGRAAGMVTVAVLTGPAERAELEALADAVLPDIGALPRWLGLADA